MTSRPHPWRRRLAWVGGVTAAWMVVLFAPIHRYAPSCDYHGDDRIYAPLRPAYADRLAMALRREGLLFLRWGNSIFLPLLDVKDAFNLHENLVLFGRLTRPGARDSINFDWRHAFSIAAGYRAEGSGFPAPAAVERLALRWETEHGEWLPRDRHGYLSQRALHRLPTCALKRAALTTADDPPGDPP